MKPILVSSGDPAGVGPDLCLALATHDYPVVILGDIDVLAARAKVLKQSCQFIEYCADAPLAIQKGQLTVYSMPCPQPVVAGKLNPIHGTYVIQLLAKAAALCADNTFSALVTAPVHKANINAAGHPFKGHTEFFAEFYKSPQVVMLLACQQMRVALVTTHLPLKQVSAAITFGGLIDVIMQLNRSLITDFGIDNPKIKVAGLNPHAGESGYLGDEEIEIISPALQYLRQQGINLEGPLAADTMFIEENRGDCDAYVAMYHDQGLPVLKYAGFGHAVNITLGLPIVRTSVDHGTALHIAGTDRVDNGSMLAAVEMALLIAGNRCRLCNS